MSIENSSAGALRESGTPPCPHRPPCPGCPRYGEPGIAGAAMERLDALARRHGLPKTTVVDGALSGFRLRARLAIRGRQGAPKIGMFQHGTHSVVTIPDCRVHHPLINRVAGVVRQALIDGGASVYADGPHKGFARYLQVVVERGSQRAQVVLVANATSVAPLESCFESIREHLGAELHSLWFNEQAERTNAILGTEFSKWCGPDSVVEHFGGAAIHYPPGAFGQNNLDIAERIVDHVRGLVREGSRVTEFYAGVGAIGLSILPRVAALRINEVSPHSLQGLSLGLAELDEADRRKVDVVPGPAGESSHAAVDAEVVIADPPRKGLDAALVDRLVSQPPERFVYVSCGLESFITDVARLTDGGRLRLAGVTAFNLLPYTEHVETVAHFDRA